MVEDPVTIAPLPTVNIPVVEALTVVIVPVAVIFATFIKLPDKKALP